MDKPKQRQYTRCELGDRTVFVESILSGPATRAGLLLELVLERAEDSIAWEPDA